MNSGYINLRRASGFSLIEMMLAMLIGLIIMAGVMQIFVSTSDTQRSSEDQLALLGDARFAMETIAYDLRHTGLWGRNNAYQAIACQKSGTPNVSPCPGSAMPPATADCSLEEYINLERPLFATNNSNPYAGTCANQSYKAGTDVLSLRYADTNKLNTASLAADVAYIRSSPRGGMLFIGPNVPDVDLPKWKNDLVSSNHLMVSRVYYVSNYTDATDDGLPSLRRGDLAQGPLMKSEVMLPGVEDLQLEFGVDLGTDGVAGTSKDGQVDSYVKASSVSNWSNGEVIAVRIWLLMRAEREDRDKVGGDQTFTFAGKSDTYSDGYRRYLVSSLVKLRNTSQGDLQEAGSK
ncbi:MAG: PilW family protein [Gammaproteobacteria bacterium]|nr:PilW family protein [Gammaproteobacteria bacterium]